MSPYAVIATSLGYIIILFTVAWLSGRKTDNAGFFTGNRKTPWYMAAIAMIGAAMSGVTFISVPGSVGTIVDGQIVAKDAFSYMQMVLGFTVGQFIIAFLLIPTFYRLKVVSLYEYLDTRFGVMSHKTGAWFFFISKMLGAALRVYIVCAVMQSLVFAPFQLPFWLNALLTMALVWFYTQRGGVKSLIWTDALKTLCLVGSLVLSILFIMQGLGLSISETIDQVTTSPLSQVFFFEEPSSRLYFWKMFFAGIVMLVAMTGLDQDMMQRNMSCPTPRDAQKNIVLTAFSQIFVIFLFLVLGVLLYLYMQHAQLAMPEKNDQVFSLVAVNGGLPTIVGVLFVLGMIASTYSAAGSALTALTTSFTVDILNAVKTKDDKHLTRTRKMTHLGLAFVMILFIIAFDRWADNSVINLVYQVASYTYGPILGLFTFGLICKRKIHDKWMPLVAILAPILSIILQWVGKAYFNYEIGFELLIYNALLTMLGMVILIKKHEN